MSKQASCRRDFISDASSSEDEFPALGSLRERLAKKQSNADLFGRETSTTAYGIEQGTKRNSHLVQDVEITDNDLEIMTVGEGDFHSNDAGLPAFSMSPKFNEVISQGPMNNGLSRAYEDNFQKAKHQRHLNMADVENAVPMKKKRTTEEIEQNKKTAQEKKEERAKLKQAKEAEKLMRQAEREAKKAYSLNTCLQFVKVVVDTHVVNISGLGVALLKECGELGVKCETQELTVPYTIVWHRQVTENRISADMKVETTKSDEEEIDMVTIIPISEFVSMVKNYKQQQKGCMVEGNTLHDYVSQLQSCQPGRAITLVVMGVEQYFRDIKSGTQKRFKKAVQSIDGGSKPDKGSATRGPVTAVSVSRLDVEEAVTHLLFMSEVSTFMLETAEEAADFVRRYTKAVAERPAKKDRFDPIFSFHEEGASAVKVDKNGVGLLKVWKQQLLQFKNISPDVAQAIIVEFPSPHQLIQAYKKCSSGKEAIKLLENIVVRRGAGVLETSRRIGKEISRRIYTFYTSNQPDLIIK